MYSEYVDKVRATFHESHQIENVWLEVVTLIENLKEEGFW